MVVVAVAVDLRWIRGQWFLLAPKELLATTGSVACSGSVCLQWTTVDAPGVSGKAVSGGSSGGECCDVRRDVWPTVDRLITSHYCSENHHYNYCKSVEMS